MPDGSLMLTIAVKNCMWIMERLGWSGLARRNVLIPDFRTEEFRLGILGSVLTLTL